MSQKKLPYIDLYPGDWLKDAVAGCSLAAQGLWLRLLFIMQEAPKRGFLCSGFAQAKSNQVLNLLPPSLARMCGCSVPEFKKLWSELVDAGVPSKGDDGIWFCRRMVKDEQLRQIRSAAGKAGGDASVKARFAQAKPQPNVGLRDGTGTDDGTLPSVEGGTGGIAPRCQNPDLAPFRRTLNAMYNRDENSHWSYIEQTTLAELVKRPRFSQELAKIESVQHKQGYFISKSLDRLLTDWQKNLDYANGPGMQGNGNGKPVAIKPDHAKGF